MYNLNRLKQKNERMIPLFKVRVALVNNLGIKVDEATEWGNTVGEAVQSILSDAEYDWSMEKGESLLIEDVKYESKK